MNRTFADLLVDVPSLRGGPAGGARDAEAVESVVLPPPGREGDGLGVPGVSKARSGAHLKGSAALMSSVSISSIAS